MSLFHYHNSSITRLSLEREIETSIHENMCHFLPLEMPICSLFKFSELKDSMSKGNKLQRAYHSTSSNLLKWLKLSIVQSVSHLAGLAHN